MSVWLVKSGDRVAKTVDLATCPALIHLANSDKNSLMADLLLLESLDATGEIVKLEQEMFNHA